MTEISLSIENRFSIVEDFVGPSASARSKRIFNVDGGD